MLERTLLQGVCLGVCLSTAHAQNTTKSPSDRSWIVTLGAGTEYGPSFEGSRHGSFSFVPSFDIRRWGEPAGLSAPDDGFDYSLFELGGVELGPVANIRGSRTKSDDSGLEGLHDISWGVVGAYAQYCPVEDKLRLRVEARQGLRKNDGFLADFAADWFQPYGRAFMFSAGPRVSLADTTCMQNNFGVSAFEAQANGGLNTFYPKAGIKSVGFVLGATTRRASRSMTNLNRLVGDAANSPIVTNLGSANQNTVGFVLSRSFQIGF
ncbi:MAG: MipA/OmpV family protein [Phyllobacterium sp.]|uniref:MipA/OmpV family protein n=1 Tax=Phyllobacterium sp. TaxID=1871046 RepID=UPI0030F13912